MAQVTPAKRARKAVRAVAGAASSAAAAIRHKVEGAAEVDGVPPYVPVYAPDRYNVKLRYADYLTAADADGTTTVTKWRYALNSVYDPYYDVGGHQPNGFDKWAAIYKYYRVMGAKVKMHWFKSNYIGAETARQYTPVAVGWYYDAGNVTSAGTPAEWFNVAEMKEKHLEFMGFGDDSCYMEFDYSPDAGGEKAITAVAQEEVWTPISSSPTSPDILNIVGYPNTLNEDYYYGCFLQIEFIVQFADPISSDTLNFRTAD